MNGLIFDMDGTMVDNMMVHHRAWQRLLKSLGLDYSLERVKEEIHGVNMEILQRLFGDRFTPAERQQLADRKEAEYRDIFKEELEPVPGLIAFLDRAKALEIPMAIATAAPPENAEFVLEYMDSRRSQPAANGTPFADYFGHIVHSDMVSKGKPNPEVIEQAAAGIGIPLSECLFFEDSVTGAQTGQNGGCPVVVITTTHKPAEFAGIDAIISFQPDFSQLWIDDDRQLVVKSN
ncbi:MAG: HAD family phosphatase [Bacteroidota bacterium]